MVHRLKRSRTVDSRLRGNDIGEGWNDMRVLESDPRT